MNTYTADNIKVLKQSEIDDRWVWAKSIKLSIQYRKDAKWIQRGLEACIACNVDESYFIDRYLEGLPVPINQTVDNYYREQRR